MITVRHLARPLVIALAASAVFAGLAAGPLARHAEASTSAPALSAFDSRLLYDMNRARAARGIRKLVAVAGTTDVAHGWSCHMASALTLAHNGNLADALASHGSALWSTYGENVGMEASTSGADRLFKAYMNSPGHRANILDPAFKYVGVWTKRSSGFRWNTVDFVGKTSSSYDYSYGSTRRTC